MITVGTRATGQARIIRSSNGRVIEETAFGPNTFKTYGQSFAMASGSNSLSAKLSTNGTVGGPTEYPPNAPDDYEVPLGFVSATANKVIEDDYVIYRVRYTFRVLAGVGSGMRKFKKAIIYVSSTGQIWANGAPWASGQCAESQLTGVDGSPTTVECNLDSEDVDLVWEFSEYVPKVQVVEQVSYTKDGKGNVSASTTHTCTIRPANFTNTDDPAKGWILIDSNKFLSLENIWMRVGHGTIDSNHGGVPTFDDYEQFPISGPFQPLLGFGSYVAIRTSFDFTMPGGVNCLQLFTGHMEWQIQIDPPIDKSTTDTMLDIGARLGITNR